MNNKVNIKAETIYIIAALLALALGTLIYFGSRSSDQVLFLHHMPQLDFKLDFLANAFIYSAPSFLHVYAFILFTCAVLSAPVRAARLICLSWLTVEIVFEIGQHDLIAHQITEFLPMWFDNYVWLDVVADYFINGRFDILDIISLALGTAAAYLTIIFSQYRQQLTQLKH